MADQVLRENGVLAMVPWSRATLWRRVKAGEFPRPIRLGPRARGWIKSEVGAWIEECCFVGPDYFETMTQLFDSWKQWAEKSGERTGTKKRFSQIIEARGYERNRQGHDRRRGFDGLAVKSATPNEAYGQNG